jgi:hypothetical protein
VAAADRPEVVALLDRFLAGTAKPEDLHLAADIFPAALLPMFAKLVKPAPDERLIAGKPSDPIRIPPKRKRAVAAPCQIPLRRT